MVSEGSAGFVFINLGVAAMEKPFVSKLRLVIAVCTFVALSPRPLPYTVAPTELASARAAAHAARLAVHAASGLAWSVGLTDVARCLRTAEGAVRAAVVQLHTEPPRHQGAESFAGKKAQEGEKAPRKRRKRRRREVCPTVVAVGVGLQPDLLSVATTRSERGICST